MIPVIEPKIELAGRSALQAEAIAQRHIIVNPCGQAGQWMLIVGAPSVRQMMMKVIAGVTAQAAHAAKQQVRFAETQGRWTYGGSQPPCPAVRVLDGGNYPGTRDWQFEWLELAQFFRGIPHALDRIAIGRACSCIQMLSMLESIPSLKVPFVVLNLLNPFYDRSVKFTERKRLLKACLANLERLEKFAGGVVSVSPPEHRMKKAIELFRMVEEAANATHRMEILIPSPSLQRLY
jgi:hypothetical protein